MRKELPYKDRDTEYARIARRKFLRKQFIDSIKRQSPCSDCGQHFPPEVMDFDHVPEKGKKVKNIARLIGGRLDLLEAELLKCDIVCSNCHRMRTKKRGYRGSFV